MPTPSADHHAPDRLAKQDGLQSADRQRLETLIEAFGIATWEWNVSTGALRLKGNWDELIGAVPPDQAAFRSTFHPGDLARQEAALATHLSGQSARYRIEARMRHRNGHYVWTQTQGTLVSRDCTGAPEWVFGFVRDISERKLQEEKLRRSESFLEQTSAFAGVGGWEIDLPTGELHWTLQTFRIAGLTSGVQPTAGEALGFYAPEAREAIVAARLRTAESGTPYEFEVQYDRADGRRIWVRSVGSAVFEAGVAVRLVGAMEDITDRVAERAALRQAHDRVTLAANGGGIGVFDWDIVEDTLYWDDWMCRLYDIERPDIHETFRVWGESVHPDDRPAAERAVLNAILGEAPYDTEFRVIHSDGTTRWLHAAGTVMRDEAGTAARMVGTNRDVTQHRQLAAELARQHEMLRVTLQSIGDAVVTTDADGRIGWLNPLAERFTGWSAAEAAGRPKSEIVRLIDEVTRQDRPDLVPICLQTSEVLSQEPGVMLVARNGDERPIENTLSPIRDASGAVIGVIIVFRDVSGKRNAELERKVREHQLQIANAELERLARHFAKARNVAEQANRAKTRFLAGMSHELRTPLNGILGYAQLLRMDGGLTELQSERVQAMLAAGSHLLEMISCVLDLSQIETEGSELQIATLDLDVLTQASLNIVRPAAEVKCLALGLTLAPDVPRRIMTDASRLRQIILNLLGNAIKYTETGTVDLRVSVVPAGRRFPACGLRFEVADTGPGISAENRHRLFAEYDRLEAHGSTETEGAGLGLSLAKRLAALLDADLGYAENIGGGSVFSLEMPLQPAAEHFGTVPAGMMVAEAKVAPAQRPDPGGPRILVVDDIAINRDIASAFIRSAGYEVVCAQSGAEAVALAAEEDFLVILMDVRMPGMDGLQATRHIRARGGTSSLVPVIALTAQVFIEQIEACREAGMDTHLAKPFTLESLLEAIARGVAVGHHHVEAPPHPDPARQHGGSQQLLSGAEISVGDDALLLDEVMFNRTTTALDRLTAQDYLVDLTDRVVAFSEQLAHRDASQADDATLAEEAHALAGFAGMFGFDRLTLVAKHFEQAVETDLEAVPALCAALRAVLSQSLAVMRSRLVL